MGRRTIRRGPGSRQVSGKDFLLADERDAWILDPADHLAARVARDGDPEPVYFEETNTTFAIGWKGNYRIEGSAFVYIDRDTGRVSSIIGYPTRKIAELR